MNEQPLPPPKLLFHQAAILKFRSAIADVISEHPEVRSVLVVLDYGGNLNDAAIDKAVWLGDQGQVTAPAAILGSIHNTIMALEVMLTRAVQLENDLRNRLQAVMTELAEQKERATDVNRSAASSVAAEDAARQATSSLNSLITQDSDKPQPGPPRGARTKKDVDFHTKLKQERDAGSPADKGGD